MDKNNFDKDLEPMDLFESEKEKSEDPYFVDRTDKVKNFIANMETTDIYDLDVEEISTDDVPEYKGEVYFTNAPKTRTKAKTTQQPKAKKPSRFTGAIASVWAIAIISLIVVSTAVLSIVGINCIGDVLAVNRSDDEIVITVEEDLDVENMIDLLNDNGLIRNATFCNLFAKFRDFDSSVYLSGVYYMRASMGLEGMLNLAKVAPTEMETVTVSIPEGYTIYQIFQRLESYEVCEAERLYDTLEKIEFEFGFVEEMVDSPNEFQKYEGYFFPDTYEFYVGENPTNVIEKFFNNFEAKWTEEFTERAKELGMTKDDVLKIASILQKEAEDTDQMKDISSVIHNRLNSIASYPRLECDASREYVTNYIKQEIGESLSEKYLQYYDTYICKGLPAGVICNPGYDAINAALNPNSTANYYFIHDNSGKLYLAETFAEHEANNQEVLIANGS